MTINKYVLGVAVGVVFLAGGILGEYFSNPSKLKNSSSSVYDSTRDFISLAKDEVGGSDSVFESAKVTRVIDGDTVEIEGGERVRYIGIDTPETVDPLKAVQCFGKESSDKNKDLVLEKSVRLERDITDRDKYGRLLRYVWVGDTLINLELVKLGYANSYSYPPDVKHQSEIVEAQKEAQKLDLGLWSQCGTTSEVQSVSPAGGLPKSATTVCSIKGNISSNGEKIYHLPGCAYYEKTVIDQSRGERLFCTEPEAIAAGWRKAGNCVN